MCSATSGNDAVSVLSTAREHAAVLPDLSLDSASTCCKLSCIRRHLLAVQWTHTRRQQQASVVDATKLENPSLCACSCCNVSLLVGGIRLLPAPESSTQVACRSKEPLHGMCPLYPGSSLPLCAAYHDSVLQLMPTCAKQLPLHVRL